ncbi:phospholipase D-like domain-containing protein [Gordonia insulae]|uniref:Cardiolipin synthase n=1 Tax=Gordonia insulae TaxID=2420509 RepID=A0A3G8JSI4_9ACTN|nr:phospholipase D-like domain-containing protein [Gordonia insulae]AZG48071.1 Cardiolipin synthase [Gordonia insulae]
MTSIDDARGGASGALLVPGQNCYGIGRADRFACIIDAADYFRFAKQAMLGARKRIMLIGWDFDTRIEFEPEEQTLDGPNDLGDFLNWLPDHQPGLEIHLLKWSVGAFTAITRGMTPVFLANLATNRNVHLEIDTRHPLRGAHHQKIVVIDDRIAFCGGIDMTVDRWDRSDHRDDHPRRVEPNGNSYGPWHDATAAVDGDAARLVGDIARQRWLVATGEDLAPVDDVDTDPWPDQLAPTMRSVDVAVARTLPELDQQDEVREIEQLYLDAIRSAKRFLYIESQYLAARVIADAIAQRLRESDGPEIVVVLPRHADGWLEQKAMDGARRRLLHQLWDADEHQHFRAYHPVTATGGPIYVHAKVLVMDDRLLRVGSSNLNNRSLGLDSECDLAVEVSADDPSAAEHRRSIVGVRDRLIAEHLAVPVAEFRDELERRQSLIGAIDHLRGEGKTLERFDAGTIADEESPLAENDLMDPESAKGNPVLTRVIRFVAGRPLRRLSSTGTERP